MNIIICGAGKVGFSISKQLSAQGHSVTVVDQSSEDIKKINDTQDVKGIVGRATLPTIPLTSWVSLIFLMSSDDWSITVTEWPCADSCLLIEKPTLPAPHIIIFILINAFNS